MLVEFEPVATVGCLSMAVWSRSSLSCLAVGSICARKELSRYFRDQVLADAQEEYVA